MHIAMVIDVYDKTLNGAVLSTQRFVDRLIADGHRVTVISTGDPAHSSASASTSTVNRPPTPSIANSAPMLNRVFLTSFYPPIGRHAMKKMKVEFAWPNTAVLRTALATVDVVHVQFPFYLGMRAITIAKQLNRPVLATFHIQAEHLFYNVGIQAKWLIWLGYRVMLNRIYNRCDRVICPSDFAATELKRYGLTAPVTVISNGVTEDYRPQPVSSPLAKAFANRFVILTVGRLAPEKRQLLIIQAIARSRYRDQIQLIIVGEGPLKGILKHEGLQLPIPPVFEYLPPKQVIDYYNRADLYVHAADVEVECMTILEAMACGLPPLIAQSDKSAASQFALDERSLFRSNDPNDLARKIDAWMADPEALQTQKSAYLAKAAQYTLTTSYEQLLATYRLVSHRQSSQTDKDNK